MKLNEKTKWQTIIGVLHNGTKKMKKNDGTSSNQSIALDDKEEQSEWAYIQATVPKRNRQVMGN
jgi:hypothetical protein